MAFVGFRFVGISRVFRVSGGFELCCWLGSCGLVVYVFCRGLVGFTFVDLLFTALGWGACGFVVWAGRFSGTRFVLLCDMISCILVVWWLVWNLVVLLCGLGIWCFMVSWLF